MKQDSSSNHKRQKTEERPSYKYRYSFDAIGYEPSVLSQESDHYWISVTPELSERSGRDLDTPPKSPFSNTPRSALSRNSFGVNTSVISEAKGLWSSRDLKVDRLMLEEVQSIRQLSESKWLQIDQNK